MLRRCGAAGLLIWLIVADAECAPKIPLPPRAATAASGAELAARFRPMSLAQREQAIRTEAAQGNVPDFWRRFTEVEINGRVAERDRRVVLYAAPDYFALGSDTDYFLTPLTPASAQAIGESIACMLPTPRMVDAIYRAAVVKLEPVRIPPRVAMTTVTVFEEHNRAIGAQRAPVLRQHPLGVLVAGHKKDVVITARLRPFREKVAIYGWHLSEKSPIQPLYLGHHATWVDYSHGIRFVHRDGLLDGVSTPLAAILRDAELAPLLSDDGPLSDTSLYPAAAPIGAGTSTSPGDHAVRLGARLPRIVKEAEPPGR